MDEGSLEKAFEGEMITDYHLSTRFERQEVMEEG